MDGERIITNPWELLDCDDVRQLLRLCGTDPGKDASDYRLFFALCVSLSLCGGNMAAKRANRKMRVLFGQDLPQDPQKIPDAWRAFSDAIQTRFLGDEREKQTDACSCHACTAFFGTLQPDSIRARPVIAETSLPGVPFFDLFTWENALRERWQSAREATRRDGERNLLTVTLPATYRFIRPDPYHVREALQSEEPTAEQTNLLLTQAVRALFVYCRQTDAECILRIEGACNQAVALIRQMRKSVGLPSVFWSSENAEEIREMVDCSAEVFPDVLRPLLWRRDFSDENSLLQKIEHYARLYPVRRLGLIESAGWD